MRASLRLRVAIAFALFGALLSCTFALLIYFAERDISRRLIDETLHAEMEDYLHRLQRNPASLPPESTSLQGYAFLPPQPPADPSHPMIEPGVADLAIGGVAYRALAQQHGAARIVLLFRMERQQAREGRFVTHLFVGVALMTVLSAAGGFWLARRVIAPVTELARAVSRAEPSHPPSVGNPDGARDEVGELARAFESYLTRLHAFVAREREFAADASHELRTPLTVISGAAEVIAADPDLSAGQRERVARIQRATQQMTQLIGALLLLAREQREPEPRAVGVAEVVEAEVERLRPEAAARGARIVLAVDARPRLHAREPLLDIVVGNLLRNAISHSVSATVHVRVDAHALTIADRGVGIPAAALDRVFDRNYKGSGSEGSGIGLALVRRICEHCGWTTRLESREGEGTTATLEFGETQAACTAS